MFLITIQTIFVYLLLAWVLYDFGQRADWTNKFKYAIIGLIIYSIFWGLRYGVGRDCISYIEEYDLFRRSGYLVRDTTERGYSSIIKFFAGLDLHSFFYMAFVAFFQIFGTYFFFKKDKRLLPYIGLIFILSTTCITYGNGMRQEMAFSFLMLSLYCAREKHYILHYLMIALAISMHNSAILLLVFLPIFLIDKDFFPRIIVQYVILAVSVVLGQTSFFDQISQYIDIASQYAGYEVYTQDRTYADNLINRNDSIGIGFVIGLFIDVLIVRGSQMMKSSHPDLKFLYNLYFIGCFVKYAFINSSLIQRVNYYFYGFAFVIAAAVLESYFANKKRKEYYILLGAYVLWLFANLYRMFDNSMAYFFIWQKDLFNQLTSY